MVKNISGPKINQQLNKLSQLKSNCTFSLVTGSYKEFVTARKEFAKEAVKNFELAKQAKGSTVKNVPLFSKLGMKMLKTIIFDMFRKKLLKKNN